ncbi:MAG: ATP-dependent zinc metalloprotease FtsH [Lachnospiraceae bacterium]|nr:ATP-dependent zinc metalloprotease FtsH [Lachnospiraceae bacterium]
MVVIIGVLLSSGLWGANTSSRLTDAQLAADLEAGSITAVEVVPIRVGAADMANAVMTYKNGTTASYYVSDVEHFRENMLTNYPEVKVMVEGLEEDSVWSEIVPIFISMLVMALIMFFLWGRMQNAAGGGGGNMANFGKAKASVITKENNPIRFADVAGLEEEKEEMAEVVDFLKDPAKYTKLGARIPKGVILVGSPGTGKTYLAKAVAGEAGVPFYSISGSDFVEMFVGVGASRVRDLFAQAKKNAPSIVFIDEIDAVGRQRGAGLGGGHDEREQTLNQLLVEMDGFETNRGVIVMAATNRVDILDPALLRPGRFDRQIVVGRPDVKGREAVLKVHSKKKPLGDDVDLKVVAQTTAGFAPADLENLMNEAAIQTARQNRDFITMADIQKAFIKVGIGTERKSRVINPKERNITAIHEAGHAVLHHVLPGLDEVHSISIIPTGMAGGYTMPLPEEDTMYYTKGEMENEIIALLGGRVAEELFIGDVTTGASNDIERATDMARNMVTKYGMSSRVGLVKLGERNEEVFLGRDIGHSRNYGENVATTVDEEIHRIVEEAHEKAQRLLKDNEAVLLKTRDLLLEKEKITGAEFVALFGDAPDELQSTWSDIQ